MALRQDAEKLVIADGATEVKGFSMTVRGVEPLTLEKGDVFEIPSDFKVYSQTFSTGGNPTEFTLVRMIADGVSEDESSYRRFYPSIMWRRRKVYNAEGVPTGHSVHTDGSAAEEFRTHSTVQEAMQALIGRPIRVTDIQYVKTANYTTGKLENAPILTLDFVK